MAQSGYTPILIYASGTATNVPLAANLTSSASGAELALNYVDGKLYYKNSSGVVALLASTSGASGDVVGPASSTDNALARFDLATGKLIQNSVGILSDAGILTGLTGITSSGSITFSGLTSGRVTYATTGGLLTDSANLTFSGATLAISSASASAAQTITSVGTTAYSSISMTNTTTGYGYDIGFGGSASIAPNSFYLYGGSSTSVKLLVNSSGNVGIGTSSPIAKLDVGGGLTDTVPATYGGTIRVNSSTQTTVQAIGGIEFPVAADGYGYKLQQISNSGANLVFANRYGSATWTEQMRLDASGNLGLGVTPSAWANGWKVIESAGSNGFVIASANVNPVYLGANWYSDGTNRYKTTGTATLYEVGGSTFKWSTAPSGTAGNAITFTQAMTLDASGNLLVTKTSQNLGVVGFEARASGETLCVRNGDAALQVNRLTNTGTLVGFYYSTTLKGTISTDGTTISYNTTSDQRLKENIQDADSASSLIDSLQVRKFDWKENNAHQRYGFIAQELVIVAPEAVHQPDKSEEMMGVDYSKLVPMLVKEIQSLRARVAQLETKGV